VTSTAQQEQQGNVHQLSNEMPKQLKAAKWYEQSESEEVFKLDQIYTCEQLGIGSVPSKLLPDNCLKFSHNLLKEGNQQVKEPVQLPFIWDWQWVLGPKSECTKAGWCFLFAENYGWKWAKSFCFIAFDPGGTLPPSKWLFPFFHTVHNLEAVCVVFDPGGKIVTTMILRYIRPSPSELGFVPAVDKLGSRTSSHSGSQAGIEGEQSYGLLTHTMVQQVQGRGHMGSCLQILRQNFFFQSGSLRSRFLKGKAIDRRNAGINKSCEMHGQK